MRGIEKSNPIFIVGMNGSGTTMLADCLDNSPDLFIFPRETRMVPWVLNSLEQYGDLNQSENMQRLLDTVAGFSSFHDFLYGESFSPSNVREPTLAGVLDTIYGRLAAREGKKRWVEKSPMNAQFLPEIGNALSDARFIHIIRDGRDVARSNQRRWKKNPYLSIYRWKNVVSRAMQDGIQLGSDRYFEVRYEDFTEEPARWLEAICAFIDIPYHDSLLRSSMPFVDSGGIRGNRAEKSGTIVPSREKWRTHFSASELKKLEALAGQLLAQLDYAVMYTAGDRQPNWLTRQRWQMSDAANLVITDYRLYGIKGRVQKLSKRAVDWMRYKTVLRY